MTNSKDPQRQTVQDLFTKALPDVFASGKAKFATPATDPRFDVDLALDATVVETVMKLYDDLDQFLSGGIAHVSYTHNYPGQERSPADEPSWIGAVRTVFDDTFGKGSVEVAVGPYQLFPVITRQSLTIEEVKNFIQDTWSYMKNSINLQITGQ